MVKPLSEIAEGLVNKKILQNYKTLRVKGISHDSRKTKRGEVFVAMRGIDVDGHNFIPEAIKKGAFVVFGEKNLEPPIPYFKVENGRLAWAQLLSNWHGKPEKKLKIIGVTGTDGKTTTVNLIYHLLKVNREKVSMISTVNAVIGKKVYNTGFHVTTPDTDMLWDFFSNMVKDKTKYAVMEVTSHSLDQSRFGEVDFDIGILTNITQDHFEYHKSFEQYKKAKAKLFEKSKLSILNKNARAYTFFKREATGQVLSYDINKDCKNIKLFYQNNKIKQEFDLRYKNKWIHLISGLPGNYNIENILATAKVGEILGINSSVFTDSIKTFQTVKGRFEFVVNKRGINILIDFAHTENALKNVLTLVGKIKPKNSNIIAVFGGNGNRDKLKRRPMGKVATRFANKVIITSEDPRSENPDQIFKMIAKGCKDAGGIFNKNFFRVDDRKKAIDFAINRLARKGDWVLLLGKSHEKSICVRTVETPWDEFEAAKESLNKKPSL